MTLKMYEIIDFPTFFEKVKNQKMSFKTSYHLTLLANRIQEHINFYQENFRNLAFKYGKKDEDNNLIPTQDGQGILLIEGVTSELSMALNELHELDVELPDIYFCFEEFRNVELAPEDTKSIIPFIIDNGQT